VTPPTSANPKAADLREPEAERRERARDGGVLIEPRRDTDRPVEPMAERVDFEAVVLDGVLAGHRVGYRRLLDTLK